MQQTHAYNYLHFLPLLFWSWFVNHLKKIPKRRMVSEDKATVHTYSDSICWFHSLTFMSLLARMFLIGIIHAHFISDLKLLLSYPDGLWFLTDSKEPCTYYPIKSKLYLCEIQSSYQIYHVLQIICHLVTVGVWEFTYSPCASVYSSVK